MNKLQVSIIFLLAWLSAVFWVAITPRSDTVSLFGGLLTETIFWIFGYFWLKPKETEATENYSKTAYFFIFLAHALVTFLPPMLSDDVYRFVWDGTVSGAGLHPLTYTPTACLALKAALFSPDTQSFLIKIYPHLNSPDYYTVYPTVLQIIFFSSSFISGNDLMTNVLVIKIIFLGFNMGSFFVLKKMLILLKKPTKLLFLIAANPLVLHELSGNTHAEAVAIFFIVSSIYFLLKMHLNQSKLYLNIVFFSSVFCFSLAIATKLLPVLYLPFLALFYVYIIQQKNQLDEFKTKLAKILIQLDTFSTYFFTIILLTGLILFPFFNHSSAHLNTSLNLYFQKFEFNASFYYLFSFVGNKIAGYNLIYFLGPSLSLLSFGLITGLFVQFYRHLIANTLTMTRFFSFMLWAQSLYFLGATTVHPWYLTTLLVFGVLADSYYPMVWGLAAMLTYISYGSVPFLENKTVVLVEYFLVAITILLEWKKLKHNFFITN